MKNRIVLSLVAACAIVLAGSASTAVAQPSPQAVTASIPPQAQPPAVPPVAKPPAPRPEPAPGPKPTNEMEATNVKIEVTMTYQVGTAAPIRRMATLTVADGGRGSLRSGNQVAVTSTTFLPDAPGGTAKMPMTSFNYKSVGLNVDANRVYIQGSRAKLDLNIEISAVDEKTADSAGKPPSFPTFSQNLTLVLESGKPLIVGQSSDYVDNVERKQSVEVKATILR